MSSKALFDNLSIIAKALSDPTRLKIIGLLCQGDYCVNALSHFLKITQPTVSQHLKILKQAGLVAPAKKGYWVHYSVNSGTIEQYLTETKTLFSVKGGGTTCPQKVKIAKKAKTLKNAAPNK